MWKSNVTGIKLADFKEVPISDKLLEIKVPTEAIT